MSLHPFQIGYRCKNPKGRNEWYYQRWGEINQSLVVTENEVSDLGVADYALKQSMEKNVPVGGTWESRAMKRNTSGSHGFVGSAQRTSEPPMDCVLRSDSGAKEKGGRIRLKFMPGRFYLHFRVWSMGNGSPECFVKRDCEVISRLTGKNERNEHWLISDVCHQQGEGESDASWQFLLRQWWESLSEFWASRRTCSSLRGAFFPDLSSRGKGCHVSNHKNTLCTYVSPTCWRWLWC